MNQSYLRMMKKRGISFILTVHPAFNRLYELYQGMNLPSSPTRVRDEMAGATSSVEGVLADFPTPILPKFDRERTREGLINIDRLISGNAASVASNLGGDRHGHLALTMTAEEYTEKTGFAFVPPYNPGDYPQSMGSAQEQALGTEKFRQNQALFQKKNAVDGALKKQIVTSVEPVLLSPLVDQRTGFGQVSTLTMLQHLFSSYGAIDKIDLEDNSVKMMGRYDPTEPLARLIEQLEKGREFARAEGQTISDAMMMSKGITLLAQTGIFNYDIREWRQQSADLRTWSKCKYFPHRAHQEQKIAVTTAGKGGYTATVQKIYSAPPPSPEEHHEAIEDIKKIVQGMRTQGYELEGLAQANAVLTSSNYAVTAQVAHMTVTMNAIQ